MYILQYNESYSKSDSLFLVHRKGPMFDNATPVFSLTVNFV